MNEVFQVEDNLRTFREEWPLTDIGSIITGTWEVTGTGSPETAGKL
jgi:hypothetical protein